MPDEQNDVEAPVIVNRWAELLNCIMWALSDEARGIALVSLMIFTLIYSYCTN